MTIDGAADKMVGKLMRPTAQEATMRFIEKLCLILRVGVKGIWCIELHKKLHYAFVSNSLGEIDRRDLRSFKFWRFNFTAISSA